MTEKVGLDELGQEGVNKRLKTGRLKALNL
jgi:hypothetical protein